MKISIMQPYFFPYIGYWQLVKASDLFLIFDDVNYIKRGWINRNRILCDGNEKFIVNPISHVSQNTLIKNLEFINDQKSINDMERTIAYAYRKAPYISQVLEQIKPILHNPQTNVADYLEFGIKQLCGYLSINTPILRSSNFRGSDHPTSEEGIISLAKQFSASHYINPIGGMSLYHNEKFDKAGIGLCFLKTDFDAIKKISGKSQMDLSIIDLMANYSPDELTQMLDCYSLING